MAEGSEVYKINGIGVKSPSKITVGNNIISRSYDDAFGILRTVNIRKRQKVNWIYNCISKEDMEKIQSLIDSVIENGGTTFTITTAVPGSDTKTLTCVLGTPQTVESIKGTKEKGVEYWKMELHWIEKEGISLLKKNSSGIPS